MIIDIVKSTLLATAPASGGVADLNWFTWSTDYAVTLFPPVILLGLIGISILLGCLLAMAISNRRLKATCTNVCSLMGIADLDYFILDSKGRFMVQPKEKYSCEFLEQDQEQDDVQGDPADVNNRARCRYKFQQLLGGKRLYLSITYSVDTPNGRKYFALRAMPVLAPLGVRRCFIGTVQDVTDSKQSEQKYHDTMMLLQTIMDSIPYPIVTKDIDDDFRYLTSNKSFVNHTGRTLDKTIGFTDFELFPNPDEARILREHDEMVLSSGGALSSFDENYTSSDGNPYYCRSLKKLVSLSTGKKVLLGISIDVTEEELAKQQLARSESKLRETSAIMQVILDNAECAIYVKNMSNGGRVVMVNKFFYDFFAVNPLEDVVGKTATELFDGEFAQVLAADDQMALASAGKAMHFDHTRVHGGKSYHIHFLKTVMKHDRGDDLMISIALNLTELIETHHKLESALERANAANRAKSYFLASVSHELRTPLNAVIGFSELMQNENISPDEQRENLEAIHYAGTTLLNLINDILDLSKLEADQMTLKAALVSLYDLLQSMVSCFKALCVKNQIEMIVDFEPGMPRKFLLDDIRIRQVMFNLLGNAVKFTSNGKITITARFEAEPSRADRGGLSIAVADTGTGIPEEQFANIFEPFTQSMNNIPGDQSYQGTGLGLPIADRMVHKMGGRIEVQSQVGKGSTFTVILPEVAVVLEAGCHNGGGDSDDQCPYGRIMLVDDVPMNLKVLEAMLHKIGCRDIVCCNSAQEVLDRVDEVKPALILADVWMPKMKGDELAQRLHERPGSVRIPVVAVTADTQMAPGDYFKGMLLKPVTLENITGILKKVLGV